MTNLSVRFGFSTSKALSSRLIRWATRSKCSHAFILLEGSDLGPIVLEAWWEGWREVPRGVEGYDVVALIAPPEALKENVVRETLASRSWLSERYNFTGLLGMAWVAFCAWLGRAVRNPIRSSHSMFCSEAAVYILQGAKWPGSEKLDPQSVSPEALLEFLSATPGVAIESSPAV